MLEKMQLRCIIVCKIIMTSEKLAQIDVDRLPKEGKDISEMDKSFKREFKKIKESVN